MFVSKLLSVKNKKYKSFNLTFTHSFFDIFPFFM